MSDPAVYHLGPADNIRSAYHLLEQDVVRALRTQLGDAARLGEQRTHALSLLQAAEPVSLSPTLNHALHSKLSLLL